MARGIKIYTAMKAVVSFQGRVLILREANTNPVGTNANRYDVTGGRVEPGERFDDALRREIYEETGLTATIGQPFYVGEWRLVVKGEQWQIIATYFQCQAKDNRVRLSRDHDDFQWINPQDYRQYPLINDIKPVFARYLQLFRQAAGLRKR